MPETSHLPGPVADLWLWQEQAICRSHDNSIFFHPEGERGAARRNRDRLAKALCARCPVIQQCRTHALQVNEPYGVWGGMTEDERRLALGVRPRSRTSGAPAPASPAAAAPLPSAPLAPAPLASDPQETAA